MEIRYKPSFIKQVHTLESALQVEAIEKITEFKNPSSHRSLRVHPLKGELKGFYSFSVNYRYRIVFAWVGKGKKLAVLHAVGDHDVYR